VLALQISPPQLGLVVVVYLALLCGGSIVGTVGSLVVQHLPNPVGKYRLLYAGVLLPFALLAYGLLSLLGFGTALLAVLGFPQSTFVGAVLADFTEFLAAGCVWLASYAPTVRGVRRVRDIDLSTGESIRRMARYVVGLCGVVTVVLVPLRITPSSPAPLGIAVSLAIVVIAVLLASPWIVPVLRETNTPAGETAERLDALCTSAGLEVRDVRILETDTEETATTLVRGPPGYRRLFVTSTFLDRFDDETAVALLAIEAGRLRSHLLLVRTATVIVGGLLLVASVTGVGPRWPLLLLSVGTIVVGFWASRRRMWAADSDAADRVGHQTLADALERYADVHALEPTRRRLPNPLSVNVALGDRIDRLREHTEGTA
jgi:STE24 endopeptidase